MSDLMLFGVLRMPYEMAMQSELSRYQFYQRAQEAADRLEAVESPQPAPQGVAGVELREKFYRNLSTDTLISTLITIVQERDAHRAALDPAVAEIVKLKARVAELEGDVARDAARYRRLRQNPKFLNGGWACEPEYVDERMDATIAAAKEQK